MTTIKEMLNELKEELQSINAIVKQLEKDKDEMLYTAKLIEAKITAVSDVASPLQESFNIVLALAAAGEVTPADMKTFADTVGLDFDQTFIDTEPPHQS